MAKQQTLEPGVLPMESESISTLAEADNTVVTIGPCKVPMVQLREVEEAYCPNYDPESIDCHRCPDGGVDKKQPVTGPCMTYRRRGK